MAGHEERPHKDAPTSNSFALLLPSIWQPVARISGAADAKVLERVIKLLSYMSTGGEGKVPAKKLASGPAPDPIVPAGLRVAGSLRHGAAAHETTPLEETAAEQSSAPVPETAAEQAGSDEDEDIFGGAGDDYKPERRGPTAPAAPSAAAPPKRDYFGSQRGIVDLLPPLPPGSGLPAKQAGAEPAPGPAQASDAAYPDTDAAYPDTDAAYPNTDAQYPDADAAYPDTDAQYPDADAAYPDTDAQYPNTDDQYPNTDDQYPDTDAQYPDTDAQYPGSTSSPQPPLPPGPPPQEDPADTGVNFYLNVRSWYCYLPGALAWCGWQRELCSPVSRCTWAQDEPDEEEQRRKAAQERAKRLLSNDGERMSVW